MPTISQEVNLPEKPHMSFVQRRGWLLLVLSLMTMSVGVQVATRSAVWELDVDALSRS